MESQTIKVENVQVFVWSPPGGWGPPQEHDKEETWIQWRTKDFKDELDILLAIAAMRSLNENDLIWIVTSKFNYLSRVKDKNLYDADFFDFIASTSYIPIINVYDFIKVGYWDDLPGCVQYEKSHPEATFRRINDTKKIATAVYNRLKGERIYETISFSRTEWFQKMISPYQDIEDIIGLYLQVEKHYLPYIETYRQYYLCGEGCSMVKEDGSHKCFLHVIIDENYRNLLNEDDFVRLTENGKNYVYLFATDPKFIKEYNNEKIIYLDADEILNFTETHEYLLPERMKDWLQYVKAS